MKRKPWFTNIGQIIQSGIALIACILTAINVWPKLRGNDLFSLGAIIFYLLCGLVVVSVVVGVQAIRSHSAGQLDDPQYTRLTAYEKFAMLRLIENGGGMTGQQLYDQLLEWGMPVADRAESDLLKATFDVIARKTTLLKKEPFSDVWTLR